MCLGSTGSLVQLQAGVRRHGGPSHSAARLLGVVLEGEASEGLQPW